MHHAGHLTTHSTELSFVGGWHGNIGTVVTIKAHYQAEGCFQHNKFATIEDFNSIDRFDRWGHNFAIYLKTDKKLLVGKGSKDEKTSFLHILRCHEKKIISFRTNLDCAAFAKNNRDSCHGYQDSLYVGNLLITSSVLILGGHSEV